MRTEAEGLHITLDLEGRRVLLVGDPHPRGSKAPAPSLEARHQQELLVRLGADVRVFVPPALPGDAEVADAALVLVIEPSVAEQVVRLARAHRTLVWVHERPGLSDLSLPALARLGAATLAVSTSGRCPELASRLAHIFVSQLSHPFARFIEQLGTARRRAFGVEKAGQWTWDFSLGEQVERWLEAPDVERRQLSPEEAQAWRGELGRLLHGFSLHLEVTYPRWFQR